MGRERTRQVINSKFRFTVTDLLRRGLLKEGLRRTPIFLSRVGRLPTMMALKVNIQRDHGSVVVSFWLGDEQVHQELILVAMPRHFGGCQYYFHCAFSDQRARVLWWSDEHRALVGRAAFNGRFAYASQFRPRASSALARLRKTFAKMGGDPDREQTLCKPKRMRWKTWETLVDRFNQDERAFEDETRRDPIAALGALLE